MTDQSSDLKRFLAGIPPDRPVLIAGPTASGKSDLALSIAATAGGIILNADALQVFECWRILTARPGIEDEKRAAHALYGHVSCNQSYSAGDWLRDLTPYLSGTDRPILVGGTGLYFSALTEGLVEIPPTPSGIRDEADMLGLEQLIEDLHPETQKRIDTKNRARVQRAWEVLKSTGRPIHVWQDETPPPLLSRSDATCICLEAPKDWLNARIENRFAKMLEMGALDEAKSAMKSWNPSLPSSKAIGAAELLSHLNGKLSLEEAQNRATIKTRQYAKRQRTWFRARMDGWQRVSAVTLAEAGPG